MQTKGKEREMEEKEDCQKRGLLAPEGPHIGNPLRVRSMGGRRQTEPAGLKKGGGGAEKSVYSPVRSFTVTRKALGRLERGGEANLREELDRSLDNERPVRGKEKSVLFSRCRKALQNNQGNPAVDLKRKKKEPIEGSEQGSGRRFVPYRYARGSEGCRGDKKGRKEGKNHF